MQHHFARTKVSYSIEQFYTSPDVFVCITQLESVKYASKKLSFVYIYIWCEFHVAFDAIASEIPLFWCLF